jgi:hydrogenase/urease accessory protein HupE
VKERRPAEVSAVVAAVLGVLVAFGVDLSEEQVAAVIGFVGVLPGVVFGVSLFLAAVGAILTFAVRDSLSGVDLDVVGIILMVVGVIGALFSLFRDGHQDLP